MINITKGSCDMCIHKENPEFKKGTYVLQLHQKTVQFCGEHILELYNQLGEFINKHEIKTEEHDCKGCPREEVIDAVCTGCSRYLEGKITLLKERLKNAQDNFGEPYDESNQLL